MKEAPPYSITPEIVSRIERIGEAIGRAEVSREAQELRLRRINRIRTIRGSLAIEGNTLGEEQISAVLDGKPVIAPPREIREARNAFKAYDRYPEWNPASEADLLGAHEILMAGLLDAPGRYRRGPVVVAGPGEVHHVGPPADRVPHLMSDLLAWVGGTREHPLIASSVFHYEFEFIHPFADGNGRMGRLWQTLILTRWKPLFADVPVESLIHASQREYYDAIRDSSARGESTSFIVYMLGAILGALQENRQASPQEEPQAPPPGKAPDVRARRSDVPTGDPPRARAERPQIAAAAVPVTRVGARLRGDDPPRRPQRPEPEVPPDATWAAGAARGSVRRARTRGRAGALPQR